MGVDRVDRLAGPRLDALQHAARQLLLGVTEAQLRTLLALVEAFAPAHLDVVYRVIVGVSLLAVFWGEPAYK